MTQFRLFRRGHLCFVGSLYQWFTLTSDPRERLRGKKCYGQTGNRTGADCVANLRVSSLATAPPLLV